MFKKVWICWVKICVFVKLNILFKMLLLDGNYVELKVIFLFFGEGYYCWKKKIKNVFKFMLIEIK